MNKIFNKKVAVAAGIGAVVLAMGATMAYFTDYATTNASGTAGTVAIAMASDIDFTNEEGLDILNPGDMRDGSFKITNMGNKSIDVRTTVALTALDHEDNAIAFTGDADTQSEYDLYLKDDVELKAGYGYVPKDGAAPIEAKSINGNVITYEIADYILNGNSDEYDEVETVDGIDAFAHDYDFVLVFKGETGNEWQASTVKMDVIVEAKQHENTGAGWDIVAQESVAQGSIAKDVVVSENVITE